MSLIQSGPVCLEGCCVLVFDDEISTAGRMPLAMIQEIPMDSFSTAVYRWKPGTLYIEPPRTVRS